MFNYKTKNPVPVSDKGEKMIPNFLEGKLEKQYGTDLKNQIMEGFKVGRKVTLRINTLKTDIDFIKSELSKNNIDFKEVSWSKEALIIENKIEQDLEELDVYKEGKIYLQSLSSMLPPIILNPEEGIDILDMAAAPGGKTTQMAALTNNKANITACEMNKIRAEKLKYNINMQGASRVFVMEKDARNIDNFFSFDKILLDSPCSGSGTLVESNPNNERYFTEMLIEKVTKTQFLLLEKASNILKKGCEMVYSTCSILEEENEKILEKILKQGKLEIVPIEFEGIPILPSKIPGTICVMPNELYEGFFVAKLKKK